MNVLQFGTAKLSIAFLKLFSEKKTLVFKRRDSCIIIYENITTYFLVTLHTIRYNNVFINSPVKHPNMVAGHT